MRDVAQITKTLSDNSAVVPGKRVRIDFGSEGQILLDGNARTVTNDDGPVDTTVRVSLTDFLAMADGALNSTMAFVSGKLKVDGDMSAAMQLQSVTSQIKQ